MNDHNIIVVLNWNANGLKKKRDTLNVFFKRHNIDIACITETHLLNTHKIQFPGYKIFKIYPVDRVTEFFVNGVKRLRGVSGVALLLLVRENIIPQKQIPLDDLSLAVSIDINNESCKMVSAYQLPQKN
jgi:exonuclease III